VPVYKKRKIAKKALTVTSYSGDGDLAENVSSKE
jgi:hypothetical protein